MADVKLPVVGKVPKGWLVFVGAGSVGAILYFRHRQNLAAQAADTSSATDTSAQDQADLGAQQSGDYGTAGVGSGYYDQSGNWVPVNQGPSITTNAQWAQYAETQLTWVNQAALGNALGKYLTGQPLNTDQESLVNQAIAFAGYPPVRGTNGFPPAMHIQPHKGHKPGKKTETVEAPGGKRLIQLAPLYHTTYATLAKLNPAVAKKYLGKNIPKGTKLIVPAQ